MKSAPNGIATANTRCALRAIKIVRVGTETPLLSYRQRSNAAERTVTKPESKISMNAVDDMMG